MTEHKYYDVVSPKYKALNFYYNYLQNSDFKMKGILLTNTKTLIELW